MTVFIVTSVFGCVCYLAHIVLKWYTVHTICKFPKLSDSKVESITKMVKPFQFRIASN